MEGRASRMLQALEYPPITADTRSARTIYFRVLQRLKVTQSFKTGAR